MRLINAKTLELEEFFDADSRPPYAILSHQWVRGEEVSFRDIQGTHRQWMPGWSKIQFCCRQALEDGLAYAWVDTCCIDKTSSTELSEAINSMYHWYAEADRYYAYLMDIDFETCNTELRNTASAMTRSKWFTRAWTLQELIAPQLVIFFDKCFHYMTKKTDIANELQRATKIPAKVLRKPVLCYDYPLAVRMSWAADRQASRIEDVAYSLFGLFEVNLPLLYGEGRRAFGRLQEEIIKQHHDHSIFVWDSKELGTRPLFALSPANFAQSGHIILTTGDIKPYAMTNMGLSIELRVIPYIINIYVALLDCYLPGATNEGNFQYGMFLARYGDNDSRWCRADVNGRGIIKMSQRQLRDLMPQLARQQMHIVRGTRATALTQNQHNLCEGTLQVPKSFHGIKISAPAFLTSAWSPAGYRRTYSLIAHHNWDESVKSGSRRTIIDEPLSLLNSRKRSRTMQELHGQGYDTWDGSDVWDISTNSRILAPEGTLAIPAWSTGVAGMIFLHEPICWVQAIKVGFDSCFRPIVFLAILDAYLDVGANERFPPWTPLQDFDPHLQAWSGPENSLSSFYTFDFDALQARDKYPLLDDMSIALGWGVYAFVSQNTTTGDHWISKPRPSHSQHIVLQFAKRSTGREVFWEFSMDVRDDLIPVRITEV